MMDKRGTTNNTAFLLAPQHCVERTPKLKRTVDIGRPRIIVQFNRQRIGRRPFRNSSLIVEQFSTISQFSNDCRFLVLVKSSMSA